MVNLVKRPYPPLTVSRSIPYIIDPRLERLRRLYRHVDRCTPAYYSLQSRLMIQAQAYRLYDKIFKGAKKETVIWYNGILKRSKDNAK